MFITGKVMITWTWPLPPGQHSTATRWRQRLDRPPRSNQTCWHTRPCGTQNWHTRHGTRYNKQVHWYKPVYGRTEDFPADPAGLLFSITGLLFSITVDGELRAFVTCIFDGWWTTTSKRRDLGSPIVSNCDQNPEEPPPRRFPCRLPPPHPLCPLPDPGLGGRLLVHPHPVHVQELQ